MKSELTEDEFLYYIEVLTDYKEKGRAIGKKKPVFWSGLFSLAEGVEHA